MLKHIILKHITLMFETDRSHCLNRHAITYMYKAVGDFILEYPHVYVVSVSNVVGTDTTSETDTT